MDERQVIRGFLANIEVLPPLIVSFQFNPQSIQDNKSVRYADLHAELGGDAPGKLYTGGGERTIRFRLHLDGLEKGTNPLNPSAVANGISTELAKLRSFLYPKFDAFALAGSLFGGPKGRRLAAPPTCYFGYGTRILECVLTELRVDETLHNSALAPVRATADVTLSVIEEGALHEVDRVQRGVLSALGLANVRIV